MNETANYVIIRHRCVVVVAAVMLLPLLMKFHTFAVVAADRSII